MVYKWLSYALSRLWPAHCYLCLQPSAYPGICPGCRADLPVHAHGCQRCGVSLPASQADPVCPACLTDPPPFARVISALAYTTPVDQMITGLKFHNRLHYAPLLAYLLRERLGDSPLPVQAIVPVPLHARRLRERGFNQALEIARPLAAALQTPLLKNTLLRVRETAPQSLQHARDRQANVHGAFAVIRPPAVRHIALVDDVMTSGHTVAEAARCLRDAGVEKIEVWCAARANSHVGQSKERD